MPRAAPLEPAAGRWTLGSGARITHALAVVVAFTVLVRWLCLGMLMPRFGQAAMGPVLLVVQFGLILYLGLLRVGRVRLRDLGWRADHLGREIAIGAAVAVAITAGLVVYLGARGPEGPGEILAKIAGLSLGERLFFTLIGLQASLIEESIFRGYLQGAIAARGSTATAVVVVAAIFALSHLRLDVDRLAALMFIGLPLGGLRGRDRPLVAPAAAHTLIWTIWGLS